MPEDRSVLGRGAPPPAREWAYGPGPDHVADVYLPAGDARPTVVLIHGGFWRPEYDRAHLRPMAAGLAAAGHPVVLPEFSRRPGDPDLGLADLREALDALTGAGVPADDGVLLVGHSAGGHHALLLAVDPPAVVRGALALAPVADLHAAEALDLDEGAVVDYLGGPAASRPDLDPVTAEGPRVPVRLLHGAADSLVPLDQSRAYVQAHPSPLRVVEGCAHFEPIDPLSSAWPAVLGELSALAVSAGIE